MSHSARDAPRDGLVILGVVVVVLVLAITASWFDADSAAHDADDRRVVAAATTNLEPTTPTVEPTAATVAATPAPSPSPTPVPAPTTSSAVPLRVHVPSIGVNADMTDLGTNPDGTLEVPVDFSQVGWYTGRAVPGAPGPAVLAGHVDSTSGPAVFFDLAELEVGAVVEVDRSDGLTARYRVVEVFEVGKDDFPTERVYGPTEGPELRLVTCGGSFDPDARSYDSNVIVMAEFVENEATRVATTP